MARIPNGWELENRSLFNDIVPDYDAIRPEYPPPLFAGVLQYMGLAGGKKALEIGPGTGKATAHFLAAGLDVTAVEIGPNMVDFLQRRFHGNKNFRTICAAFEDVSLEAESYDLIYAASAFHWVDAAIGCPKLYRLLKPGGTAALFRYHEIPAIGEALYEEVQVEYENHYYSHYTASRRPARKSHEDLKSPTEIFLGFGFADLAHFGFRDVSTECYDAERTYTTDERMIFLNTLSDHRALPENNREALFRGIKRAILRHGGTYKVKFTFQLCLGKK